MSTSNCLLFAVMIFQYIDHSPILIIITLYYHISCVPQIILKGLYIKFRLEHVSFPISTYGCKVWIKIKVSETAISVFVCKDYIRELRIPLDREENVYYVIT
jgi:hypothetical protein